jgi:hypothetical protein
MKKRSGHFLEKLKFLIPILILVAGGVFLYLWEFHIKNNINTVEVVVAKHNIKFKDKITKNDLVVKHILRDSLVEDSYRPDEMENIIGTYASITINEGTQIYPNLIDNYDLIPNEKKGEFIAPIPDEWLFAVPGSLRRSYVADIYVVGDSDQALIESLIRDSMEHDDSNTKNKENTSYEGTDEKLNTDDATDEVIKEKYMPILQNIRVASVKDGSNKEVTKAEGSNSPQSATGTISEIEIIATDEILQKIREKVELGYKLYIVYKFERSSETEKQENHEGEVSE